ncbi:tyrosine-type recombinase/integrase [Kribbella sp. NBC_01510]|uniref:tyrosine-type recombinase/integrase n=1 Tax=Kribbella sp. NBC_01510 TaxID=2903581 RepID=UPI003866EBB1
MTVLRPASETAMPGPSTLPRARELRPVAQAAWDAEYDRDVWRLRELGIDSRTPTHIRFDSIPQPWLKALAKRWARWRLAAGFGPATAASGTRAVARFGEFLAAQESAITSLGQLDRTLLERYLAHLHALLGGRVVHRSSIGQLNMFLTAIRQHGWDDTLPTTAMFFPEDFPKEGERLPRALSETVMAQLEHPDNLARWGDPAHRLVTLVMMRCGLRIGDALRLSPDCITRDGDGAPYLRYFNHKMRREALVPIDAELERELGEQRHRVRDRWPGSTPVLFPQPTDNPEGQRWMVDQTYRRALRRWLETCDVRDEHGQPVNITPHRFRHTLGTRLINQDVPQEVVRRILDHDSHVMTAHYARLSDTTIRRHWEKARKVNISGQTVSFDPSGPLADAAWAKQRLGRATQALPNGYCGLPLQQSCPHANACLSCPMFITTADFLPQHHEHRQQVLQIISAAEARGQRRLSEMNQQVLGNLDRIIGALDDDSDSDQDIRDES